MRTYCQHLCPHKKRRLTSSPITFWTKLLTKAITLHGEFDFSDDARKDSLHLDIEALLAFNWE